MTSSHFPPDNSNLTSPNRSLRLIHISDLNLNKLCEQWRVYFVDIGDAFAKIEFSVFDAVATFDFDEGDVRRCVALAACVGDVFASNVEPSAIVSKSTI